MYKKSSCFEAATTYLEVDSVASGVKKVKKRVLTLVFTGHRTDDILN